MPHVTYTIPWFDCNIPAADSVLHISGIVGVDGSWKVNAVKRNSDCSITLEIGTMGFRRGDETRDTTYLKRT